MISFVLDSPIFGQDPAVPAFYTKPNLRYCIYLYCTPLYSVCAPLVKTNTQMYCI